jgi:hypothetical protein
LLLRWRQLVGVAVFMSVVVVAAAVDCCGGSGPVQLLKTINRFLDCYYVCRCYCDER